MRIPRLTWAGGPGDGPDGPKKLRLDSAQARHGVSVLRLAPGDLVEVAGPAGLARARVTMAQGGRGRLPILEVLPEEGWRPHQIESLGPRLALALVNMPRFDWAVEKAAELGAGELRPLLCERIKPGLARAALARAGRWRRLAEEARKQCGRANPLAVRPTVTTAELLAEAGPGPAGFFLCLSAEALTEPEFSRPDPWLLVGPEGGFSPGEEAAFLAAGLKPWRLGPLTLRSETAALAALSRAEPWTRAVGP